MSNKLLLIEDNSHKRDRIVAYLEEHFSSWNISEANSFTAASRCITNNNYDVILMDMSLPTYSKNEEDSGGRFRTFGGREIARKILRKGVKIKILFVTQYEAFSDQGAPKILETLDSEMSIEYGQIYAGLIHYDSSKSNWKDSISKTLKEIENENSDR